MAEKYQPIAPQTNASPFIAPGVSPVAVTENPFFIASPAIALPIIPVPPNKSNLDILLEFIRKI